MTHVIDCELKAIRILMHGHQAHRSRYEQTRVSYSDLKCEPAQHGGIASLQDSLPVG